MKIKFAKRYLESIFFRLFLLSTLSVAFYHTYFYIFSLVDGSINRYSASLLNVILSSVGFYFSIVPIKILSTIFPNWYLFTTNLRYPISSNGWVFILEQAIVIIFVTLTIFAIYILQMWIKRIYLRMTNPEYNHKWSYTSRFLGIISLMYYFAVLLSVISVATGVF
jgi:hypothetical protein